MYLHRLIWWKLCPVFGCSEIYTANTYVHIIYIYIHIRHIMITKITILQCHWWLGMTRFINQDYEDPENFPVCSHSLNLDLESKTTTTEIQTFIQTLLLGSCWVWYAIEYRCFPDWNLSLPYLGYHILPMLVYLVVLVWLRNQGNWAVAGYNRVIFCSVFDLGTGGLLWSAFVGWFQRMASHTIKLCCFALGSLSTISYSNFMPFLEQDSTPVPTFVALGLPRETA